MARGYPHFKAIHAVRRLRDSWWVCVFKLNADSLCSERVNSPGKVELRVYQAIFLVRTESRLKTPLLICLEYSFYGPSAYIVNNLNFDACRKICVCVGNCHFLVKLEHEGSSSRKLFDLKVRRVWLLFLWWSFRISCCNLFSEDFFKEGNLVITIIYGCITLLDGVYYKNRHCKVVAGGVIPIG